MEVFESEVGSNMTPVLNSSGKFNFNTTLITVLSGFVIFFYISYKSVKASALRFLVTPPHNFRQTFSTAIDKNGLVSSSLVGIKSSSFRRRLVLGSKQPLSISTLPLNTNDDTDNSDDKYWKLRIPQADIATESDKESFLINIKPIEPDNRVRKRMYGFFHPYSYANGGGERVLWEAVQSTIKQDPRNICVIYTFADNKKMSVGSLLLSVKSTFGIDLYGEKRLVFIHLNDKYKWTIDSKYWSFASIIMQSISSIFVMLTAINQCAPDALIDTQGFPFTYFFVFACLDIPIVSYVHYPLVSSDMLKKAKNLKGLYSYIKYGYWWMMLKAYQTSSLFASITLCNSTWTMENIKSIWGWNGDESNLAIMYPPCVTATPIKADDINNKSISDVIETQRDDTMVYLAQFRKEKRHLLLIDHYAEYIREVLNPYKLILIGSTRTEEDLNYIEHLRSHAKSKGLVEGTNVVFELNAPTELVEQYLSKAQVGLNCMWKEHFGIAVVEYALHGAIPLVHASAGPLLDIVVPWDTKSNDISSKLEKLDSERSGLFFIDQSDPDFQIKVTDYPELKDILKTITVISDAERKTMRSNAINVSRSRFGRGVFAKQWDHLLDYVWNLEVQKRDKRAKVERVY